MLAEVRSLSTRGKDVILVVASLDRLGRRLLEAVRCRDERKAWASKNIAPERAVSSRSCSPAFSALLPRTRSIAAESACRQLTDPLSPPADIHLEPVDEGIYSDQRLDRSASRAPRFVLDIHPSGCTRGERSVPASREWGKPGRSCMRHFRLGSGKRQRQATPSGNYPAATTSIPRARGVRHPQAAPSSNTG
jgi:hypothetical protein